MNNLGTVIVPFYLTSKGGFVEHLSLTCEAQQLRSEWLQSLLWFKSHFALLLELDLEVQQTSIKLLVCAIGIVVELSTPNCEIEASNPANGPDRENNVKKYYLVCSKLNIIIRTFKSSFEHNFSPQGRISLSESLPIVFLRNDWHFIF